MLNAQRLSFLPQWQAASGAGRSVYAIAAELAILSR